MGRKAKVKQVAEKREAIPVVAQAPVVKVAEPEKTYIPVSERRSTTRVFSKQDIFDQKIKEGWIVATTDELIQYQQKRLLQGNLDFVLEEGRTLIYLVKLKKEE